MRKVEIFTAQIQEKTLPGWLRGKGFRLLIGEHLRHWGGPELPGERVVFAQTIHQGGTLESEGMTLWFLLPDAIEEPFPIERLGDAAVYIFERLHRKAHQPTGGFNNVVLIEDQPTGNN